MLIIGAKGFAKEILEIFHQKNSTNSLFFFDDITPDSPDRLYEKFRIIKSEEEAKNVFITEGNQFTIGIGNPKLRLKMYEKFKNLGGKLVSTISNFAEIGSFGVKIKEGCNILGGVRISNDVTIGKGCIIYYNSIITHDVEIGKFCEISPSAVLLGRCKIGKMTQIGAGATIFPDVVIGENCIIAAGAVVRTNIPNNTMVAGVPATIKKNLK
ncbi:MAG: acetyltransferase [Bergeyella zoohelcum]|nr:acetyltransferase [Bergeyella zoohelcum]